MRFTEKTPSPAQMLRNRQRVEQTVQRVAGQVIADKTKEGQRRHQTGMRAAQLGGLANAIKSKSGPSTDQHGEPNFYGVIYVADGDDSRTGQAIRAYTASGNTVIRPVNGDWLWYQTAAMARQIRVGGQRGRLTPERYRSAGSPLGPLRFAKIDANHAMFYVDEADVAVKNGRASAPGARKSRTKIRTKRVVIFWGIRFTERGKRWDPRAMTAQINREVPVEIARRMATAFADMR